MKLSSVFIFPLALHLGCAGARIVSPTEEGSSSNVYTKDEEKEYVRDESKSIVEVLNTHIDQDHRMESSCGQNERVMLLSMTTDKYGYETSFSLETLGGVFASGPPKNQNYADDTTYNARYCVKIGQQYRLKVKDKRGDGMCCGFGKGRYSVKIGGEMIYNSNGKKTFTSVGTHAFRVKAPPSSSVQSKNLVSTGAGSSNSGCVAVKVKADKNPDELSWRILNKNGNQVAASPALKALTPVSKQVCLPRGQYEFVMLDKYGDGMCCNSGDGYLTLSIDGKEIARASHFQSQKRFKIQIKPTYEDNMSRRDRDWLNAHNTRRRKYHAEFGASYVPLKWSPQLAVQAKRWATKLLGDCDVSGIQHEKGILEGENLAKNRGSGSYGALYPVDNIMSRWVEKERHWGYPRNAHLTQCLWRSTKYLGCGEASRPFNNGRGTCRVQVCRYSRAGNCNMNAHKATIGNNWIKPMMQDQSKCGPDCAPEGCY